MLVTDLEIGLAVIGIGLIAFGIYGIVHNKFNGDATAGGAGVIITLPLAAWMVFFGLSSMGFAVYLASNGVAKDPVALPAGGTAAPVSPSFRSNPASSPAPAVSARSTAPASPASPATASPMPAASMPIVKLDSPATGTQVSASKGFPVAGSNSFLGSDTIWILDYNGGSSYTVDEPAATFNGKWTAYDGPGLGTDPLPFPLIMAVILADPVCNGVLNQHSGTGNSDLSSLPAGCRIAAEVKVDVSRP